MSHKGFGELRFHKCGFMNDKGIVLVEFSIWIKAVNITYQIVQ
jgi:hypothetical protein